MDALIADDVETLIFLHIPKTAGSTLNAILESHYTADESYATSQTRVHPDGSYDGFHALSLAEKRHLRLLTGHMGFGFHRYLPQKAGYITVLRDPVERVLSHYSFERHLPLSPVYQELHSGEMDLEGYLRFYANVAEMDNLQTRIIAGNWQKRGEGPCTPQMLATAKENLRAHFLAVGLTERFDEFYLLLKRRLGWPHTFYLSHNRTRQRISREALRPDEVELIRAHNRYDQALYQDAQELFAVALAREDASFGRELRLFQLANGIYNLYWRARAISLRTLVKRRWPGIRPGSTSHRS